MYKKHLSAGRILDSHLRENPDFTFWSIIFQTTCPRPDGRPARNTTIAEKRMVAEQHDLTRLDINWLQFNCKKPNKKSNIIFLWEIRSFVTANVIIRPVHREYLEAFQSPATFANWEIPCPSRFYFLLSKVVLAPKKEQEHPKH